MASLLAGALGGPLGPAGCGDTSPAAQPPVTMMPPTVVNMPTTTPMPYTPQYPPLPPQVQRGTSGILATPHVIPVFFSGDKLQSQVYTFIQNYMTRSTSWQVLKEYGVGYGTVAPPVVLTQTLASSLTDKDVQAFLGARVQDGSIVPTAQSMVMLYYPASVTINISGQLSCQAFAGYHGSAPQANGSNLAYAVLPRCSLALSDLTYATSHELAEAATDPYLAAYNDLNDPYGLWQLNLSGAEVGDLCQNLLDARANEAGVGVVTRLWSNVSVAAFNNPCLPAAPGPAFFSIPVHTQLQNVQINTAIRKIEQIPVTAGQTATVDIRLLSTSSPSPTWTVTAKETPLLSATGATQAPALSFAWVEAPGQQYASGENGTTLHLKITAKPAGPLGYTTIRLVSTGLTTAGIKTETDWVGVILVTK